MAISDPRSVTGWYKNGKGGIRAAELWRLVDYRKVTAEFEPAEHEFTVAKVPE